MDRIASSSHVSPKGLSYVTQGFSPDVFCIPQRGYGFTINDGSFALFSLASAKRVKMDLTIN
jgi:hypothetical protein